MESRTSVDVHTVRLHSGSPGTPGEGCLRSRARLRRARPSVPSTNVLFSQLLYALNTTARTSPRQKKGSRPQALRYTMRRFPEAQTPQWPSSWSATAPGRWGEERFGEPSKPLGWRCRRGLSVLRMEVEESLTAGDSGNGDETDRSPNTLASAVGGV